MNALTARPALLAVEGPKVIHSTREAWLTAAVESLRPIFEEVGCAIPEIRVSVGFPGGPGKKASVIGQCWPTGLATDGVANLFVSPVLDDREDVLATLAHEIVHAVDDCKSGHKGAFRKIALAIGLRGKMTATVAGEELAERLSFVSAELGLYPHGALRRTSGKTGTGRMRKCECGDCGFISYTSQKWIDTFGGRWECPCGGEIRG
jgi:hypothetical protein